MTNKTENAQAREWLVVSKRVWEWLFVNKLAFQSIRGHASALVFSVRACKTSEVGALQASGVSELRGSVCLRCCPYEHAGSRANPGAGDVRHRHDGTVQDWSEACRICRASCGPAELEFCWAR